MILQVGDQNSLVWSSYGPISPVKEPVQREASSFPRKSKKPPGLPALVEASKPGGGSFLVFFVFLGGIFWF